MYVDGLFSTITGGLTKTAKFVTAASNPILSARTQYATIKNMWNNPLGTPAAPTAAAPTAAPARSMTWGAPSSSTASLRNGAQVQELQTLLKAMGINPGPIDGLYGTKTAAGIRQFQGLAGLPQTGKATAGLLAVARSMASAVRAKAPTTRPFPSPYPAPAPVPATQAAQAAKGETPAWVIPVAVGGAALLFLGFASQVRR